MKKTLGGERLGSGKKMQVELHNYGRSTHNQSYAWRSPMACGTMVQFINELSLNGSTFEIELEFSVQTKPTVGALYGSYKISAHLFQTPIRLYQGQLAGNKLNIGMNMAAVKLPQLRIRANNLDLTKPLDGQQINPSSRFAGYNIMGIGKDPNQAATVEVRRDFLAISELVYWDVYKNYRANKQEEVGAVIHSLKQVTENITGMATRIKTGAPEVNIPRGVTTGSSGIIESTGTMVATFTGPRTNTDGVVIYIKPSGRGSWEGWDSMFEQATPLNSNQWLFSGVKKSGYEIKGWDYETVTEITTSEPQVKFFPLENIDTMREDILTQTKNSAPFIIDKNSIEPYNLIHQSATINGAKVYAQQYSQEGLGLVTYSSDVNNNWLSTEWIDGDNGVNAITAIDTSEGNFTIDTLTMKRKVYDMLNRIAVSGGSYYDWQDAVYTHMTARQAQSPMYEGGMMQEIQFNPVVSTAESADGEQPIGTLVGRGVLAKNGKKGGLIRIKTEEPSLITGYVDIVPRIDYSQGNKWDMSLKTMDDFHKPALDQIGFQDLVTDTLAYWDTDISVNDDYAVLYKSAGKQPAWINYMTNVNIVRGGFAEVNNQMFMVLARRYEADAQGNIKDLTTYIDPVKFNYIFAQTSRDAMNFDVQIGVKITSRKKMSAKQIPNL